MRIKILAVGKIKEKYIQAGVDDYVKRCRRYLSFDVIEVKEEREPKNPSENDIVAIKKKEAEYIAARIGDSAYVIALDVKGQKLDSTRFAEAIQATFDTTASEIVFIIGGSNGLHDSILKRSDKIISFSNMTFPHQLFRLIVCEQCYRALTILKGQKYHK